MAMMRMPAGVGESGAIPEVQSVARYSGSGTIYTTDAAYKTVLLIYGYSSGDPQNYFTLGGNAPDIYKKSSNAYVLQWNDVASGSALASSSGSWTVDVIFMD